MVAELLELQAFYLNGMVRMTWRYPINAPGAVHIYCVRQSGDEIAFDNRFRITRDLRDCSNGISFEYSGISNVDVMKVTFCVFLADRNFNAPAIRSLLTMPRCFISVTIGRAHVLYDIKSKPCSADLMSHKAIIKSSSSFDAGILGYSYDFNGKNITVEFPGRVSSGINVYPPIYLPRSTRTPIVCLVGASNNEVILAYKRITTFRKPYARFNY